MCLQAMTQIPTAQKTKQTENMLSLSHWWHNFEYILLFIMKVFKIINRFSIFLVRAPIKLGECWNIDEFIWKYNQYSNTYPAEYRNLENYNGITNFVHFAYQLIVRFSISLSLFSINCFILLHLIVIPLKIMENYLEISLVSTCVFPSYRLHY